MSNRLKAEANELPLLFCHPLLAYVALLIFGRLSVIPYSCRFCCLLGGFVGVFRKGAIRKCYPKNGQKSTSNFSTLKHRKSTENKLFSVLLYGTSVHNELKNKG